MSIFKKDQPTNHDSEIFVIYDSKSGSYKLPINAPDKFEMIRSYEQIYLNTPQDQLIINAEDFSLFKIGEYYKKTGVLKLHDKEHVANCHELKASLVQKYKKSEMGIAPT